MARTDGTHLCSSSVLSSVGPTISKLWRRTAAMTRNWWESLCGGQRGEEELGGWCTSTSLFPKHSFAIQGEAKVLQTLKAVSKLLPWDSSHNHLQNGWCQRVLMEPPCFTIVKTAPLKDFSSPESLDSSVHCGTVCQFTHYKASDKCKQYSDRSL